MRTNLGRVSPLPRGAWADSVSYSKGDIVRSKDAAYIALQESSGVEPGASAMWMQYWKLIASDGNQADLELLSKSLSLANEVIGMEATAQSVPYGSPIAVFSSADPTQNSLSLHFQIPRNSEFVFPPAASTMYSYNGTVLPALPEWDKETYPYAFISNEIFDKVCFYALEKEPYNNGIAPNEGTICNPYDERIPFVRSYLSDDGNSWGELTTSSLADTGQISEPFWSNFDVKYENGSVQLFASEPVPVYEPIQNSSS